METQTYRVTPEVLNFAAAWDSLLLVSIQWRGRECTDYNPSPDGMTRVLVRGDSLPDAGQEVDLAPNDPNLMVVWKTARCVTCGELLRPENFAEARGNEWAGWVCSDECAAEAHLIALQEKMGEVGVCPAVREEYRALLRERNAP